MALITLVERVTVSGSGTGAAWYALLFTLNAVALALCIAMTLAWARHGRRGVFAAGAGLTVFAASFAYAATVAPGDIPTEWVTILHHGLGRKAIMHLYAHGAHAGENFAFVVSTVAAGNNPTLYDVVWLNLLLSLVNAIVFLFIAAYVAGPAWALPWTLVFALNPAMFLAAFSELPTHLLALYFLAGVVAWAVATDPLSQPRGIRVAAHVLCALLTLLVALTRADAALLGVVALGVQASYLGLGRQTWTAAWRRIGEICTSLLRLLDDHPPIVVALCVVGVWLAFGGLPSWLAGRSETSGLYPFNPSILELFFYLPMLAVPIGVSIATAFGFVRAIRHFRRFAGLALSLLILVRVYFAAESQYYEMGRYLSYVLPSILVLALFGRREIEIVARRYWHPTWRRAARVGYLMAWFTLPLPGIAALYVRPDFDPAGGVAQLLLDLNTQREVRYLLNLTAAHPDCVFVGRVVEDHYGDPKVAPRYDYIVFGRPVAHPAIVAENEMSLADVVARYAAGASCVRLYYGGDCNLDFTDGCARFIDGRRLVEEQRSWSRPYNDPLESGNTGPEVVLATYAWP